jgi:hypothetical protein
MTEENIMTLRALINSLEVVAAGLGDDITVDADLEFSIDDPEVMGKIKHVTEGKRTFRLVAVEPDKPIFRGHGERIVRERLEDFIYTAQQIVAGLDGFPFTWSEEHRRRSSYKARRMGATLITPSFAQELGLRPIAGQQPVGAGQFDWGRKRKPYGQLYVMECQLERIPPKEQQEVTSNNDYQLEIKE